MQKRVLVINDLPGYGKVALSAMIPILSYMGHRVYNLPTALVSNTLDYGKFEILDTTDYMRNAMRVWAELGFSFDAISTGFIVSERQAAVVEEFCRKEGGRGALLFTDPIMGDGGRLYNGVTEQTVARMRKLAGMADYIVPNYTEAVNLAGMEYREQAAKAYLDEILKRLADLGAKSVVITSVRTDKGHGVVGFDHKTGQKFLIPFDYVPVRFPGTGDIFSAIFMGKILEGCSLYDGTKKAVEIVGRLIAKNTEDPGQYKGISLERELAEINGL